MLESYLIRGLLIGLIFGVPAGAIGALTIQRTLNGGFSAGLATGLGSSAADLIYACAGIFGVTLVSNFLIQHQRPISLLGGLLIAALGVHIFRQKPQNQQQESNRTKLPFCFASSFAIAVTNPATVLSFLMAFTAFEITGAQTVVQSVQLIAGIFLGTLCWWSLSQPHQSPNLPAFEWNIGLFYADLRLYSFYQGTIFVRLFASRMNYNF